MKKTKECRFLALLLALLMTFTTLPMTALTANAEDAVGNTTEFAGGSGTEGDPFLISTKEHLDNVRFYMSAHFKMIDDIVFDDEDFAENGPYYNNGSGWEPIGYAPDSFQGVFDGGSHCISNLKISRDVSYVGLFGTITSQGVVKNLRLADSVVTGASDVGGIAGRIQNSIISNCYVLAKVTGSTRVGGVVGGVYAESTVELSSAHGTVQGEEYVGGICGYIDPYVDSSVPLHATIQSCYNTATVTAENIASGIVGYSYASYAHHSVYVEGTYGGTSYWRIVWYAPKEVVVKNCYNIGNITATKDNAGGIIAGTYCKYGPYSDSSNNTHKSTLSNSYNIGEITATSSACSIAPSGNRLSSTGCYYLEGCVEANTGVGTKLTHNQMRAQSTFTKWDFETVWTLSGNADYLYPELRDVPMEYTKSLTGISIATKPNKLTYIESKDTLDLTGAKLMLKYDNNTTDKVDITADMVSGFDNTIVGGQTIKVFYGGFETSFDVTILAKTLTAIAVTTLPNKLAYLVERDSLDVTGGKITASYDNDTHEVLDMSIDMISGFDNTKIGVQTLTVTFGDKTASYEIEVLPKTLMYIDLVTLPSKLTYKEGKDLLDVTGGRISLYYNDDTTEEIDMTADMVSGFNNTTVGKQTLLVSYEDKTATYEIEIIEKQLVTIAIAALPAKLIYLEGKETLDVTGGKITLSYDNDSEEIIDITTEMVAGFDNTRLGTQVLTVKYGEKTTNFTIEVIHAHSYDEEVIAPTCTEKGYTLHTCSVCGDSYTDAFVDALGHSWDDGTTITEVTCTTNGKMKFTCTVCGATKEEPIFTAGHKYIDVITRPSCTTTGYTTHTCSVCGDSYKDTYVGATGHAWNQGVEMTKATCTTSGEKIYTCGNCGETKSDAVAPLGHSYNAKVTAPTCTEAGYTTYTCSACGDTYTGDTVAATGHSYTAKITNPTCTKEGFTTYTCSACGDTYTGDTVAATGHNYSEKVTAPTCTEAGFTTYTCTDCGHSYAANAVPATGHSFNKGNCTLCNAEDPDYVIPNPFVDVKEGDYFYDPVLWAVKEGITTGTSSTTFGPEKPCTRGQVVTFLWRAFGSPEPTKTDNPFSDVSESAYYYKAVLWAVEQGITTGISKTAFGPDKTCTRGQVATFLWRAQDKPTPTTTTNPFADIAQADYYYSAVLWAVEEGITNGTGKGLFSPDKDCTRGQIVTFLYRALS